MYVLLCMFYLFSIVKFCYVKWVYLLFKNNYFGIKVGDRFNIFIFDRKYYIKLESCLYINLELK